MIARKTLTGRTLTGRTLTGRTQERLDWLAINGICTSITYGPAEGFGIVWTVNCLSPDGQDFARLQMAHSFDHAVEIAVLHSIKLGFVEGPGPK
jgi:hypothetical protein